MGRVPIVSVSEEDNTRIDNLDEWKDGPISQLDLSFNATSARQDFFVFTGQDQYPLHHGLPPFPQSLRPFPLQDCQTRLKVWSVVG